MAKVSVGTITVPEVQTVVSDGDLTGAPVSVPHFASFLPGGNASTGSAPGSSDQVIYIPVINSDTAADPTLFPPRSGMVWVVPTGWEIPPSASAANYCGTVMIWDPFHTDPTDFLFHVFMDMDYEPTAPATPAAA